MEKYLPYSKETLLQMRTDLMIAPEIAVRENIEFPTDGHLYKRVSAMAVTLSELTQELETRNDGIIDRN